MELDGSTVAMQNGESGSKLPLSSVSSRRPFWNRTKPLALNRISAVARTHRGSVLAVASPIRSESASNSPSPFALTVCPSDAVRVRHTRTRANDGHIGIFETIVMSFPLLSLGRCRGHLWCCERANLGRAARADIAPMDNLKLRNVRVARGIGVVPFPGTDVRDPRSSTHRPGRWSSAPRRCRTVQGLPRVTLLLAQSPQRPGFS
jgi:hypothetical protein